MDYAVSLPGLAALGALLFTWMQVGQANKELRISEHGEITSRFNAAIGNLGSQSLDVRLGGIYALQRIMQDSTRDQPAVVSVLAAFAQRHAGSSTKSLKEPDAAGADDHVPMPDVQAAVVTLARRLPNHDAGTIVDLSGTDLRGLRFPGRASIKLPGADLSDSDLRWAKLSNADFSRAVLGDANLKRAFLDGANLMHADLEGASLLLAKLQGANLREADLSCGAFVMDLRTGDETGTDCVDLQYASLERADLRNAEMSQADLHNATLTRADLRGADLTRSDLSNADLTNADLRGAKLTGAKLVGAKRIGARGLPSKD
ncbi:pentapeptide repeat-containing protein [Streptomyces collinus]|uniref:pentapeptide repeat-containing protein n=1 Tax=Streptomyces collinus TaxID=42684 RepID=UPI00332E9D26